MTDIKSILADLRKDLGPSGKIAFMAEALDDIDPTVWVKTGVELLDGIIGGGIPVGRIIEIYGQPVTGKTLLALSIIAHAQTQEIVPFYIDGEKGATKKFMENMGRIDKDALGYTQVECIEDAFKFILKVLDDIDRTENPDTVCLFVIDSIASLPTRQELEADIDEPVPMGVFQRKMRQAMRKITQRLDRDKAILLCINQEYQDMTAGQYQPKHKTYGGDALKYHASTRLKLQTIGRIKEGNEEVGVRMKITVVKNRFDPPGRTVEVPIRYNIGIDDTESIVEYLYRKGAFGTRKGWIQHEGKKYRLKEMIAKVRSDEELHKQLVELAFTKYIKREVEDVGDIIDGLLDDEDD